jgi:tRNA(Ile)-lysidine synthase
VEKFRRTALTAISFSDPMIAFLDAQKMEGKGPMVFRSVLPHEKFWPYGAGGHVEVNEFLKKQKLLKYERMRRGVVSLGKNKEILWVVGMRISNRFKITPQTKEILKISYEPG